MGHEVKMTLDEFDALWGLLNKYFDYAESTSLKLEIAVVREMLWIDRVNLHSEDRE